MYRTTSFSIRKVVPTGKKRTKKITCSFLKRPTSNVPRAKWVHFVKIKNKYEKTTWKNQEKNPTTKCFSFLHVDEAGENRGNSAELPRNIYATAGEEGTKVSCSFNKHRTATKRTHETERWTKAKRTRRVPFLFKVEARSTRQRRRRQLRGKLITSLRPRLPAPPDEKSLKIDVELSLKRLTVLRTKIDEIFSAKYSSELK